MESFLSGVTCKPNGLLNNETGVSFFLKRPSHNTVVIWSSSQVDVS